MKRVVITVTVDCRDDVPPRVLEWMANNLRTHVLTEFLDDYDPDFVTPAYEGPPVDANGTNDVQVGELVAED